MPQKHALEVLSGTSKGLLYRRWMSDASESDHLCFLSLLATCPDYWILYYFGMPQCELNGSGIPVFSTVRVLPSLEVWCSVEAG